MPKLTLRLDDEVIEQAKVLAAGEDMSLHVFVAELIRELVAHHKAAPPGPASHV